MSFDIRENLKKLPESPGVYLHHDDAGQIIYVGKAVNLKRRVANYFRPPEQLDPKTRAMVSHIAYFEYIRVGSELEALVLENNLIKKYKPPYNIDLRDDKTYPYLKVTLRDKWPRLLKTRRVDPDGARYFGPYTDVDAVNRIVDFLNTAYSLKRCNAVTFPPGFRPCLYYHMGQCRGMCIGKADPATYSSDISDLLSVLDGKNKELVKRLREEMDKASEALEFEKAAALRDRIFAVEAIAEKQRITMKGPAEMDIVLTTQSKTRRYGIVFFVRDGKLSGRDTFPLGNDVPGEGAELTSAFLKQYYMDSTAIPREILTDAELPEREVLEDWLSALRGDILGNSDEEELIPINRAQTDTGTSAASPAAESSAASLRKTGRVHIEYPQRGEKKALLALARRDVVQMLNYLDEKAASEEEKARGCNHLLQKILNEGYFRSRPEDGYSGSHAGTAPAFYETAEAIGSTGESPVSGCIPHQPSEKTVSSICDASYFSNETPSSRSASSEELTISGPPSLPENGLRLEAYDISHLAGTDTVSGMVVFRDGKPLRKDYRKFRIKGDTAGDDEAALQEVLYRRVRRFLSGDPGFTPLPDIFLIDGGAGQVNAVKQVLTALEIQRKRDASGLTSPVAEESAKGTAASGKETMVPDNTGNHPAASGSAVCVCRKTPELDRIPVIGMVKDEHHRTRALLCEGTEFPLEEEPVLFRFIGMIQEEVHRFSIEYQRALHGKNQMKSVLEEIPGIGEKRRNALLLKFGSVENIRKATEEELSSVPGMNEIAAKAVWDYFRNK